MTLQCFKLCYSFSYLKSNIVSIDERVSLNQSEKCRQHLRNWKNHQDGLDSLIPPSLRHHVFGLNERALSVERSPADSAGIEGKAEHVTANV